MTLIDGIIVAVSEDTMAGIFVVADDTFDEVRGPVLTKEWRCITDDVVSAGTSVVKGIDAIDVVVSDNIMVGIFFVIDETVDGTVDDTIDELKVRGPVFVK